MIETRKEYIIINIVFINTHFNVWGKYGVPLSVNHVFVNTIDLSQLHLIYF